MEILSSKQEKVYQILKNFIEKEGLSPTLSELQQALLSSGMSAKSKRGVVQYLESLEKKGYILRSSEERGINLVQNKKSEELLDLPIYGTANAGAALAFAEDNIQGFIKISKKLLRSVQNIFALQIAGDSMNRCVIEQKHIENGDYVVIDKSAQNFTNNDVVLAIVEGCATVKKLKKTLLGEIVLIPESYNPNHQPIYIHESDSFFLNGKVINVLKSPNNL